MYVYISFFIRARLYWAPCYSKQAPWLVRSARDSELVPYMT